MSNSSISGLYKEELGYDIVSDLQTKVGKGIFYISEYYFEDVVNTDTSYVGGESLSDLESHLRPPTKEGYSVQTYDGKINITVDVVNEKGEYLTFKLPYEVGYESEGEGDFQEELGMFVSDSYEYVSGEVAGAWLESDNGDFKVHQEIAKGLDDMQVFTYDKDVFLDAIYGKYGKSFIKEKDLQKYGIKHIMEDLVFEGGTTVIERFRVGYKETNTFEGVNNFVHLSYILDVKNNNVATVVKKNKIIYVEDANFQKEKILEIYRKLNNELMGRGFVGVATTVKNGKHAINVLNIENKKDLQTIVRIESTNTKQATVIYSKKVKDYLDDKNGLNEDIYITKQNMKYKNDSWVLEVRERFDLAVVESKELSKYYNKNLGYFELRGNGRTVIAGTHYALVRVKDGYRVIYNLKEEGISISEASKRVGIKGDISKKLQLILSLVDGRRKISKDKIEEILGV